MLVTPSGGEQVQQKVMEVLKAAGRLVDSSGDDVADKPLDRSSDSVLSTGQAKTTTVFMSRKSVVKPDEVPKETTGYSSEVSDRTWWLRTSQHGTASGHLHLN